MTSPLDDLIADLREKELTHRRLQGVSTEARKVANMYQEVAGQLERLRPLIEAAQRVADTRRTMARGYMTDSEDHFAAAIEHGAALDALCTLFPEAP